MMKIYGAATYEQYSEREELAASFYAPHDRSLRTVPPFTQTAES